MGSRNFTRRALVGGVVGALALALTACGGGSGTTAGGTSGGGAAKTIVMGFAQVGAESGWRTANTKSIQESAKKAGVELKFSDAQQKQENQIKAIRSYIQQKVDVIGFSPVVETGWDTVLKEAKDAVEAHPDLAASDQGKRDFEAPGVLHAAHVRHATSSGRSAGCICLKSDGSHNAKPG